MPGAITFPDGITVLGQFRVPDTSILPPYPRDRFAQDDNAKYVIPLTSMRVHDNLAALLTNTATADDMGLVTGTPGTDAPTLQGVDFGGTSTDEKASFQFQVPPEYVAGQSLTVRVRGYILTTLADTSLTVDVEAWPQDDDGAASSDICTTGATSINSLTPADKDFVLDGSAITPGALLTVRISFAGSDSGNAGVMIPEISKVTMLVDIKG